MKTILLLFMLVVGVGGGVLAAEKKEETGIEISWICRTQHFLVVYTNSAKPFH